MTLLDWFDQNNDERDEGERLLANGPASTDPLRSLVPIPPGIDPRVVGFVARSLSFDLGLTRGVGSTKTRRKVARRRHLEVWDTTDRDKTESWLASHPDYS